MSSLSSVPPKPPSLHPDIKRMHVVFLGNFIAPNLIAVMKELSQRVGRLTILSSVEMESNRDWKTDTGGLDVVIQNTWTLTRKPVHPSGYQEINYIHVPLDTLGQLRRLKPDAIVSLEMGARSVLSSLHCRFLSRTSQGRRATHVLAVYASERSEAGRGPIRRWLRRRLLARADVITSNGPSCTRLLKSYGAEDEKIMPWDYAADPRKIYADQIPDRKSDQAWNILTVGQLSQRKGMLPAAKELARWATDNPNVQVQWNIVGTGPLADELQSVPRPDNLHLLMHGHRSPDQIAHDYRNNDVLLFPTLADEWGLVVDEALHSGLPVIGSVHSQASQTLIDMGGNGWTYDPDHSLELSSILDQVQALTADQYQRMTRSARQSVQLRTPETSARQLVEAIVTAVSP